MISGGVINFEGTTIAVDPTGNSASIVTCNDTGTASMFQGSNQTEAAFASEKASWNAAGGGSGAEGASSAGGASAGMFAFGVTVAGFQTLGAAIAYGHQKSMMKTQHETKIMGFDHQETMAGKQRDSQLNDFKEQKARQTNVKEANTKYLAAQQELKKAQGNKQISAAELKEARMTKATGSTDKRALDKLFDTRGKYRYGNAVVQGQA